jgi:hypothetical protein
MTLFIVHIFAGFYKSLRAFVKPARPSVRRVTGIEPSRATAAADVAPPTRIPTPDS